MEIQKAIIEAKKILAELPVRRLKAQGFTVDRIHENPEAARYFLMFAEWKNMTAEEIFGSLDTATAKETQVYIDFPFCNKLCDFCAFYGIVPVNAKEVSGYFRNLKAEIKILKKVYFARGFKADALEFGGGTPTFLPLGLLKEITKFILDELPFLRKHEFNFEASPETLVGKLGIKKLEFLKSAGANRMSIGIQSFDDRILKSNNRPHSAEDVVEAIKNSRRLGFERINADLMLGIYGQSVEDFLDSVKKAVESGIDIIELYTMRYFDTKEYVSLKRRLNEGRGFLSPAEILTARIAADCILRNCGYFSSNGRTYEKSGGKYGFYAAYYEGNFKGKNTLGIGRKSNSNIYPWQYANYRNLTKYQDALKEGKLPIGAGAFFSEKARMAKLLTGMFQLPQEIDYLRLRGRFERQWVVDFDKLMDTFLSLGVIRRKNDKFEKTYTGFLFIEEILKHIYELAVTPFGAGSLFLGEKQAVQRA
ncbi:radical SAM protein [bacterium]|nr:MAG: radical SAM protein [bacterium]